jgi:hypothetical protein
LRLTHAKRVFALISVAAQLLLIVPAVVSGRYATGQDELSSLEQQ